jgi:Tfp pilus assembly protein PilX
VITNKGQIALIALLVLAVATTVGLALISRGTTNVATTKNAEESTRAFSAAETGIEAALVSGVEGSSILDAVLGTNYKTTVATVSAAANVPFSFPKKTIKGETETIWLVSHDADGALALTPTYTAGSMDVCWSSSTPVPALVATLLYKESSDGSYRVTKGAYDPDAARAAVNKFSAPTAATGGCGDGATKYKQTVTFSGLSASVDPAADTLIMLRMRPVYADAQVAVVPNQALPDQFTRISSVGKTSSGTTRKIDVIRQFNAPSSIFDAAVYSQGSFVQQ